MPGLELGQKVTPDPSRRCEFLYSTEPLPDNNLLIVSLYLSIYSCCTVLMERLPHLNLHDSYVHMKLVVVKWCTDWDMFSLIYLKYCFDIFFLTCLPIKTLQNAGLKGKNFSFGNMKIII